MTARANRSSLVDGIATSIWPSRKPRAESAGIDSGLDFDLRGM
jgi:hypothetical protein